MKEWLRSRRIHPENTSFVYIRIRVPGLAAPNFAFIWIFKLVNMLRIMNRYFLGNKQNFTKIIQVAAKEKLNELQLRVRQLLDQAEQITKEQNYQRYREERFRQTSESTNSRVLWWSIGQAVVLLLTGAWQMRHLKGFFEYKKLV